MRKGVKAFGPSKTASNVNCRISLGCVSGNQEHNFIFGKGRGVGGELPGRGLWPQRQKGRVQKSWEEVILGHSGLVY